MFPQALKEAFKIFDKNKNGYIEAKELRSVTTTLGQRLTDEEFQEFWNEADQNGDGKLDYNEFINIMLQYWAQITYHYYYILTECVLLNKQKKQKTGFCEPLIN